MSADMILANEQVGKHSRPPSNWLGNQRKQVVNKVGMARHDLTCSASCESLIGWSRSGESERAEQNKGIDTDKAAPNR
jgi:hypothetical protein